MKDLNLFILFLETELQFNTTVITKTDILKDDIDLKVESLKADLDKVRDVMFSKIDSYSQNLLKYDFNLLKQIFAIKNCYRNSNTKKLISEAQEELHNLNDYMKEYEHFFFYSKVLYPLYFLITQLQIISFLLLKKNDAFS